MTDQNLFDTSNTNPGTTIPTSSDNPFADKLGAIVNENGEPKYKDVDSALEALKHSQEFIKTLQSEKQVVMDEQAVLKAEIEKRASVEDVVQKLIKEPTQKVTPPTGDAPAGLDESKVMDLVAQVLNQNTQSQIETDNLQAVVKALTDVHGDKAQEVIRVRAKELNTEPASLEALARSNPAMALDLLKVEAKISTAPSKPTQTSTHILQKEELAPSKTKLITGGATAAELKSEWDAIKADVYEKNNVQT